MRRSIWKISGCLRGKLQTIINVDSVSFGYEETLLHEINLHVRRGEFIAIFGPNGGGKTTFLKLLMGFLKPKKGSISILGLTPKKARKEIGYVPQIARFDRQFPLTVLDLVLMGALSELNRWGSYKNEIKERARSLIHKMGLSAHENHAFGTLSGGQAQRALIARALLSSPEVLLLDEPTANVDPKAEEKIHELLLELKGKTTILMVTHHLQSILKKADRLLCVQRTLTSYSPEEVCKHFTLGLYHT